jgi:lantibiotic biosynthesis protein
MNAPPAKSTVLDAAIDLFVANSEATWENWGLLSGNSGEILVDLYLYKYTGGENYIRRAQSRLESIFDMLNTSKVLWAGHSLSDGLAGIGLMLTILSDLQFIDQETLTSFEELKPLMLETVDREMEVGNNDLFYGAFGILYYLSFTKMSAEDNAEMEKIVARIMSMMLRDSLGFRLLNLPPRMPELKNRVNFGLAHGNCGFLIVLLRLFRLGYCRQEIHTIVSESIKYIAGNRNIHRPDAIFSQYPYTINEQDSHFDYGNRMAWCYGDTNVALVLYTAGLLFNNSEYMLLADDIGLATCGRTLVEDTRVSDSHFCHGSSGLAAYYAYLYRLTGRPLYRDAYISWIKATMSLLRRDIDSGLYEKKNGLLSGLSGPLLTLLGHQFNDQGALWNRVFTFY